MSSGAPFLIWVSALISGYSKLKHASRNAETRETRTHKYLQFPTLINCIAQEPIVEDTFSQSLTKYVSANQPQQYYILAPSFPSSTIEPARHFIPVWPHIERRREQTRQWPTKAASFRDTQFIQAILHTSFITPKRTKSKEHSQSTSRDYQSWWKEKTCEWQLHARALSGYKNCLG